MADIEDERVILPLSSLKKAKNKDEGPEEIPRLRSE